MYASWVLASLVAEHDVTLVDAADRLAADVDRLRRLATRDAA